MQDTRINWEGFTKLRSEGNHKVVAAMCNRCKQIQQPITQKKFDNHRMKCPNENNSGTNDVNMETLDDLLDFQLGFYPNSSDDLLSSVNKLLAKFFITAGVPFEQVENKYFLKFLQVLVHCKMDYKPPDRKTLSVDILNEVYEEQLRRKKGALENRESVLLTDEWWNKSTDQKYLVFSLRNENTYRSFLSYVDVTREQETDKNFQTHINNAIKYAKEEFNTDVVSVVTDNDSNITSGARLARTIDQKKLIQSTCATHSGRLLIESYADDDLLVMIRMILQLFKANPLLKDRLISLGGTMFNEVAETSLSYIRDSCLGIKRNLKILRSMCDMEDILMPDDVVEYIKNRHFERILTELLKFAEPICALISNWQNPKCNIADAAEDWLSLRLPTDEQKKLLSERIDSAIWPVGYAANLLHHKYCGKLLDDAQLLVAKNFLREHMNENESLEYDTYLVNKDDNFNFYAERCTDPIAYWGFVSFKLKHLPNFAIKLLMIPASTALVKPLFSQWTFLHDPHKNRLDDKNFSRILDVYYSLNRDLWTID